MYITCLEPNRDYIATMQYHINGDKSNTAICGHTLPVLRGNKTYNILSLKTILKYDLYHQTCKKCKKGLTDDDRLFLLATLLSI